MRYKSFMLTGDPPLDPPIDGEHAAGYPISSLTLHKEAINATSSTSPPQLAAMYLRTANIHKEHVKNMLNSLRYQHEALLMALGGIYTIALTLMSEFRGLSQRAQKELEKKMLLAGVDANMKIAFRVKIHAEFMSSVALEPTAEAGKTTSVRRLRLQRGVATGHRNLHEDTS